MRKTLVASVMALLLGSVSAPVVDAQDPTPGYEVVAVYPHDSRAFTQGLEFWRGRLFEGTGLFGESDVREVDLISGAVLRRRELGDRHFGEGITIFDRRLYQLTWTSKVAFVYRAATFRRIGRFGYRGEGWGLTHNRWRLVMSNGTSRIAFRSPRTFRVKRRLQVVDHGEPVDNLNELEWVKGRVYANVWPSDIVVVIDPGSGEVVRRLDLGSLRQAEEQQNPDADVTNGIAYLRSEDRLFVTGKRWSHVYEIRLD